MSADKSSVPIMLLNKEYRIACPENERASLIECANFLNARMLELQRTRKVARFEQLTLMVALNLSNEILNRSDVKSDDQALVERIRALSRQVDHMLTGETSAQV
jgi:cell division protein ZapA